MMARLLFLGLSVLLLFCCKPKQDKPAPPKKDYGAFQFTALTAEETGLDFANNLKPTAQFNMFNYMYFYNGAGVGAADFNNDGLVDLFFAGNQVADRIYLNKGELKFEDVTFASGIVDDSAWSTGVSIVDINQDGWMDIYVCRASRFGPLKGRNVLWVNQGVQNAIPVFKEQAADYGLDFSGLSTQAAFLDGDQDGDLDLFLMNHAPSHVGRFAARTGFLNTYDSLSGDRYFERQGNRYADQTRKAGIHSSAIGYGLGVVVADINLDGSPDIYVGNDFHENDYLYINNGRGIFTDELTERTMHTSQFTMGVDAADITNDGYPEIITMDMLPADHYMQKRSLGEDSYDIFQMKLRYGYHPFFTRNNLQLNRRNGNFSEIGFYAGVAATDWTWSSLFADFDNDGLKDLFVSNGIPKRLNDIDWVSFISQDWLQAQLATGNIDDSLFQMIERFPEIKLPNYFFRNSGNARFENAESAIRDNPLTFSNGAVYADLDNDGDLDLVCNNVNGAPLVYRNESSAQMPARYIRLEGPPANRQAWGAQVVLYSGGETMTFYHTPVHGYMSSMHGPLAISSGNKKIDSAWLIWPDNSWQLLDSLPASGMVTAQWKSGLPRFDWTRMEKPQSKDLHPWQDFTTALGIEAKHTENHYQEFNREQLLPQMTSTDGPALAVGDLDGDGLEDFFLGGARGYAAQTWRQTPSGKFVRLPQPALDADAEFEDTDALFADVNGDGNPDLMVASGGNEFYGENEHLRPRLYLNNGSGIYERVPGAFDGVYMVGASVAAADVDGDGDMDVFLGARAVPFGYGLTPKSGLFINDGRGNFTDKTDAWSPELRKTGMVRHAVWNDMDGDGKPDLIVSHQWGPVQIYYNRENKLEPTNVGAETGWWNFTLPFDVDGDGRPDLVAGNLGLNNRFTASTEEPLRLYIADFDNNGVNEQVFTYYLNGQEVPFAPKDEITKQLPALKKKYLLAEDFAKAGLKEIFGNSLDTAVTIQANTLANGLFVRKNNGYVFKPLDWMAQLSCFYSGSVVHANSDSLPDLLLAGNFYENNLQMGRNDADFGILLINRGKGNFEVQSIPGMVLKGQVRRILPIRAGNRQRYMVGMNNGPVRVIGPVD